jgi:hypothetical protein
LRPPSSLVLLGSRRATGAGTAPGLPTRSGSTEFAASPSAHLRSCHDGEPDQAHGQSLVGSVRGGREARAIAAGPLCFQ